MITFGSVLQQLHLSLCNCIYIAFSFIHSFFKLTKPDCWLYTNLHSSRWSLRSRQPHLPLKTHPRTQKIKPGGGKITSISDWLHSGLMLPLVLFHQEVPDHPVDDSDNHFDRVWQYSWLFFPTLVNIPVIWAQIFWIFRHQVDLHQWFLTHFHSYIFICLNPSFCLPNRNTDDAAQNNQK